METNFTPEDTVAAARFMREQAPRLPHAQRRALLEMLRVFDGVDVGPRFHPELGDVGGSVTVSIPVLWSKSLLGSVDFTIAHRDVSNEPDDPLVVVWPLGNDFFRPIDVNENFVPVDESDIDEAINSGALSEASSPSEPQIAGEHRIEPDTGELFVKNDAASTPELIAISWPTGSNSKVIPATVWDSYTRFD